MTIKDLLGNIDVEALEKMDDATLREYCKPYLLPESIKQLEQQIATAQQQGLGFVVDTSSDEDEGEEVDETTVTVRRKVNKTKVLKDAQAEAMAAMAKALAMMAPINKA